MARIINLTPHVITVIAEDGSITAQFPSEGQARATQEQVRLRDLNGIEVVSMKFGEPVDLPEPSVECGCFYNTPCTIPNSFDCQGCDGAELEKVYYIVSNITAQAAKAAGRTTDDLLLTTDLVRDEKNQVIGCRRFAMI